MCTMTLLWPLHTLVTEWQPAKLVRDKAMQGKVVIVTGSNAGMCGIPWDPKGISVDLRHWLRGCPDAGTGRSPRDCGSTQP